MALVLPPLSDGDLDSGLLLTELAHGLDDAWWLFRRSPLATPELPWVLAHPDRGLALAGPAPLDPAAVDKAVASAGRQLGATGFAETFGVLPPIAPVGLDRNAPVSPQLLHAFKTVAASTPEDPDWIEWLADLLEPAEPAPTGGEYGPDDQPPIAPPVFRPIAQEPAPISYPAAPSAGPRRGPVLLAFWGFGAIGLTAVLIAFTILGGISLPGRTWHEPAARASAPRSEAGNRHGPSPDAVPPVAASEADAPPRKPMAPPRPAHEQKALPPPTPVHVPLGPAPWWTKIHPSKESHINDPR